MPMSGLASGLRPYQQEPTTRASTERRDTMKNSMIKQVAGLTAAACTTLVIFSAGAALADSDRAALHQVNAAPATVVATAAVVR
jgi:hypothetical protein